MARRRIIPQRLLRWVGRWCRQPLRSTRTRGLDHGGRGWCWGWGWWPPIATSCNHQRLALAPISEGFCMVCFVYWTDVMSHHTILSDRRKNKDMLKDGVTGGWYDRICLIKYQHNISYHKASTYYGTFSNSYLYLEAWRVEDHATFKLPQQRWPPGPLSCAQRPWRREWLQHSRCSSSKMGVSINDGAPKWMVYKGKIPVKWMI